MEVKILEIRDRATFIPMFAMKMQSYNSHEHYLLRRAGYSGDYPCILFGRINGGHCHYDPYHWGNRTYTVAHDYITKNWDSVREGDVIDVEFILGETTQKKFSEREENSVGYY